MQDPVALISAGRRARASGDLNAARSHYGEAAEGFRQKDNRLAYAHTVRHIADMYLDEQQYAAAQPLYEEALEIYRSDMDTKLLDLANAVRPYALLHEAMGNPIAGQLWLEARNLYASLRIEAGVQECDARLKRFKPMEQSG